jgi:hypothetical protein
VILYEDQRNGNQGFGLHDFVCQSVEDRIQSGMSIYELRNRIVAVPKKGAGNLRNACREGEDIDLLKRSYRKIFALFDQDRFGKLLNLGGNPCRQQLKSEFRRQCTAPELELVLLNRNIESVIRTIGESKLTSIPERTIERALAKDLSARNSVFNQCAKLLRDDRARLLSQLPDVERLVSKVAAQLSSG